MTEIRVFNKTALCQNTAL